jgi:hypothetical protein
MKRLKIFSLILSLCAPLWIAACSSGDRVAEFRLTVAPETEVSSLTGRIFVLLDDNSENDPFSTQEFIFARDIREHNTVAPIVIGRKSMGYPSSLTKLPPGQYAARAVADLNADHWDFAFAPGNLYSSKTVISIDDEPVSLSLEHVVPDPSFSETELQKEVRLRSRLLSEFHGRPTDMKAAVILPPSYFTEPERLYPAVYTMPGYGGSHYHISMGDWNQKRYGMNLYGLEKVFIFLDLNCAFGTHCFVDSENNGPWGKALVKEFVPFIEKNFRIIPEAEVRLLTGQSSGAWAALWLQVSYPDYFGGAWAVSPDPVDFRSFCGVNLYEKDANVFYVENGKEPDRLRPLIVSDGKTVFSWKDISGKEAVTGPGGFMGTFEAQFSPKGTDGQPVKMWNRQTGRVDADIVEHWKQYDISRVLRESWAVLGPKLKNKLHIFVADDDDARLDDPIRILRQEIQNLAGAQGTDQSNDPGANSYAFIRILPSGGHGDGVWRQIIEEIHSQMDQRLKSAYPDLRSLQWRGNKMNP